MPNYFARLRDPDQNVSQNDLRTAGNQAVTAENRKKNALEPRKLSGRHQISSSQKRRKVLENQRKSMRHALHSRTVCLRRQKKNQIWNGRATQWPRALRFMDHPFGPPSVPKVTNIGTEHFFKPFFFRKYVFVR